MILSLNFFSKATYCPFNAPHRVQQPFFFVWFDCSVAPECHFGYLFVYLEKMTSQHARLRSFCLLQKKKKTDSWNTAGLILSADWRQFFLQRPWHARFLIVWIPQMRLRSLKYIFNEDVTFVNTVKPPSPSFLWLFFFFFKPNKLYIS